MKTPNIAAIVALLLVAVLALAGCGGQATPPAQTIDVVMNDIYYGETNDNMDNPPTWTVTSGAQVTVNIENRGALQHNWAIVKAGVEVPNPFMEADHGDLLLYNPGILDGGASSTATFTAPEPGEYLVICTVAGHYPLMQGRLVVN